MRSDRQCAWMLALGLAAGAVLLVVGTWRLAKFNQHWRAIVRVKVEKSPENWTNRPFNPYFLQERFESASNTFTDSVFRRELEKVTGLPVEAFRYLRADLFRGTSIIELKFVGRTETEVKLLGEKAVQLWLDQLKTNAPSDPGKFLETVTLTSAQDRRNSFRQWRRRHLGF